MDKPTTYQLVPRPAVPAGDCLVVGLALSGQAAARLLAAHGRRVVGVDRAAPEGSDTLGDFGVEVHVDCEGTEFVADADFLVKSPGVPRDAPVVAAALAAGKPVIGELELGWRMLLNPFVAVTGTNGKTTTTELLGQIYRDAGLAVAVAGNVGTPVCSLVENIDPSATVICEASSFQIEDAPEFTPECGILLNLAPDHLSRHGSFEAYCAAKLGMFAGQGPGQFAVRGPSVELELPGDGRSYRVPAPDLAEIGDAIAMQGAHNKENAVVATQAALLMGVDPQSISRTLATFTGLPHRMELIAVRGGVSFVNDSKATNVAATAAALSSYDGSVRLLLGGSDKGEDFAPLAAAVAGSCAAIYLSGDTAAQLEIALGGSGVPLRRFVTLDEAFAAAVGEAQPGETVLLSPAAASFDQFKSYGHRGDHFRQLVAELPA